MGVRIWGAIQGAGRLSEFEAYCFGIQQLGAGAPTVDEARKDYQAAVMAKLVALSR